MTVCFNFKLILMRILLIPAVLISIAVLGQQKENKLLMPKKDTIRQKKYDLQNKKLQREDPQNKMYKMPSAKPDQTRYSSLKDKRKDTTDYKMLNSIIPQKHFNSK